MHHLIFGRVKYSVYISLCDVHECKLFTAWLLTAIDLISFWCWQSNAGDKNKDWGAFQSTDARPIDELTTKTDAFFQDLWFSDKSKTVNTQIRVVVLVFRFSGETEKQVICPGGFPVVGFPLTPFLHLFKWVHRQPLPNIFVWGKSDEACTIKTEEISNSRRLHCLETSSTKQSLYQLAFRRKKNVLHGNNKRKLSGKRVSSGRLWQTRKAAVNGRQD